MGTFIADGAAVLPDVKTDARAPTGATTEWAAADTNEVRQALLDLRTAAISGTPYDATQDTALTAEAATRAAADTAEATARAARDVQLTGLIASLAASGTPAESDGNAVAVTASGSTAPRVLADRFADVVNVLDFGADPSGGTDSTAAIEAALAAVAATGGGEMHFPAGEFLFTAPLIIEVSNLTISGVGRGTVLRYATTTRGIMIGGSVATTDVVLRDFTVTAGTAAGGTVAGRGGVTIDGDTQVVSRIRVENVRVFDVPMCGIVATGASDVAIVDCEIENVAEHGVYVSNCTNASVVNLRVTDAHQDVVLGSTSAAVKVSGGSDISVLSGDLDAGEEDSGIGVLVNTGAVRVLIDGTRVRLRGTNHVGIRLDAPDAQASNIVVDGGAGFAGAYAVWFSASAAGCAVRGLLAPGTWAESIVRYFTGATGCVVDGALVQTAAPAGYVVSLGGATTPVVQNVTALAGAYGIDLGSSVGAFIDGCNFRAFTTPYVLGTATGYEINGGVVNVLDFGADPSGVADSTAAVEAAFAALPAAGGKMLFPPGAYSVSDVDVSGKPVVVSGYGAVITCTGASGAFYKTDHGPKLTVEGIAFIGSGTGRAISHNSAASGSAYDELLVADCQFTMGSGVYGVYSVGTREGRFSRCTFFDAGGGNGIYFKDAVSPFVTECVFRGSNYTGRAVYYPGTGNGTDAGLVLGCCEIMGWDVGLESVGCDWLHVVGCTIDYNNHSIILQSQDGGNIVNNYLGSLGANPALYMTSAGANGWGPDVTEKVIIQGNTFTGHYTAADTYDCILMDGDPGSILISGNVITFYTRYGVNFDTNNSVSIFGNVFTPRGGHTTIPIFNAAGAGDSLVRIAENRFPSGTTFVGSGISLATWGHNDGYSTEASGTGTVLSGNTSVLVTHGLPFTPLNTEISVMATNGDAAVKNVFFDGANSTQLQFAITSAAAAGGASFAWQVKRLRGL